MLSSFKPDEPPIRGNGPNTQPVDNYYKYYDTNQKNGPTQVYGQPAKYSAPYYMDANGNIKYFRKNLNQSTINNALSKDSGAQQFPPQNFYRGYTRDTSLATFGSPASKANNQYYPQYPSQQQQQQHQPPQLYPQQPPQQPPQQHQQPLQLQQQEQQQSNYYETTKTMNSGETQQQVGYYNGPKTGNNQYPQNQSFSQMDKNSTDRQYPQNMYNVSTSNDQYSSQPGNQSNYYNNSPYQQALVNQNVYNQQAGYYQNNQEKDNVSQSNISNNYSNLMYSQQSESYYGNHQPNYYGEQQIPQQSNNNYNKTSETFPSNIQETSSYRSNQQHPTQSAAYFNEIEVANLEYSSNSKEPINYSGKYSDWYVDETQSSKHNIFNREEQNDNTPNDPPSSNLKVDPSLRETFEQLYQNIPLCKTCAETIRKHFYISGDIEEVKKLLPENIKSNASISKDTSRPSDVSIVDPPENDVTTNVESDRESLKQPVGDTDSAIYEGHPTKVDKPSVQNFVEDKCSRCGGWTLVQDESQNSDSASNNT